MEAILIIIYCILAFGFAFFALEYITTYNELVKTSEELAFYKELFEQFKSENKKLKKLQK